MITRTPADARVAISDELAASLRALPDVPPQPAPRCHVLRLTYDQPTEAHARAFYPGARLEGSLTVSFEAENIFEVARAMCFL